MISTIILGLVLAPRAIAHRGHVQRSAPPDSNVLDFAEVFVQSCKIEKGDRKWVAVYADKELTIPMPNPVATDMAGAYLFYTQSPYVVLVITGIDGKSLVIENCLEAAK